MKNESSDARILTRRRLLTRVGLAASAAYLAPAMAGFNAARASGASGGGSGGGSGASDGASGPSRSGASSGTSGPSRDRGSRPSRDRRSRPSRPRNDGNSDVPAWLRRMMQGA